MECDFTEKISRLVDNELAREEAKAAAAHLAVCDACRDARADFLSLRESVKSYPLSPAGAGQRRALRRILAQGRPPLWKRRVQLPAPAFALMLAALLGLGVWAAFVRRGPVMGPTAAGPSPAKVLPPPAAEPEGGIDLARFDRGGRAAIYKVKRVAGAEGRQ